MSTDRWGIDDGYFDAHHKWNPTSAQTRAAILQAMGVESPDALLPDSNDVRFVESGKASVWSESGELRLEDGIQLRVEGHLPPDLPLGYHEFRPFGQDTAVRLIVAPPACPLPPHPIWGWSVQLYAARSNGSWGIGDFGDLRRLAEWSRGLGAGLLMVNPLVANTPTLPQEPSPYFPSSRRFRNPLYIQIETVPGAAVIGQELERLSAAGRALNAQRTIDRDAVWPLKQEALRKIWEQFPGDPEFEAYVRQRGQELDDFAVHCALSEQFGPDWRKWPEEYRHPRQPAVYRFAQERRREVAYHQWSQWLLDRQLAAASRDLAMVHDLPIGFNSAGADAWVWQSLLAERCTVGAPPDIFNTAGQDWGLPPFIPHRYRAAGYEPFIQTIRASLRHAGGLRIDHVMGLFRLYWIPGGFGPAHGTYVRYNARELMAIVALESHRAGAFVVGEDLGTVEMGVREQLRERNLLSFRLLWFEEQPPQSYPPLAMAAATTHDLPTVAGLWTGRDQEDQIALGFKDTQPLVELRQRFGRLAGIGDQMPMEQVVERAYRLLGEAPSLLLTATLDDALAVTERPNMPGTVTEWPNWRLAIPGGLEALEQSELPRRIAQALQRRATR